MRDFVKTSKFVEGFNKLVNDVQNCFFADARPNEYYTQHMYMLYGDDAFGMRQQTMGDVEIEEFTDATDRLKSELPEIVAELVELCPTLPDMPLYFAVWQRILAGMKAPTNEWWEERMYEEFWEKMGVHDFISQLRCGSAVQKLQDIRLATRQTIEDVRQKYSLKGDQEAENNDAEQQSADMHKDSEKGRKGEKMAFIDYVDSDKEKRIAEAKKVRGKGRDALRKMWQILFSDKLADCPSYKMFEREFGRKISRSDYYEVIKEFS